VLLFYSFGSEVDTAEIASRLHDRGVRLLLPYLDETGIEAAEVLPDDDLTPTDYGPKEPTRRTAVDPGEVDVVVAPGLAFDRRGGRLGYGGGHYDRYLARLGARATRIGIAFSMQLLEEIPTDAGDERLDVVVTDEETVRAGPGGTPHL
ncbi:MAG TPA: 5-formyltetrahydrofolate cyclo-ligase, partial [Actinomycetota bacterium]|nr:5-formyltetrahydrofolate cyclo-ligase [Actinomycetota bacterium]